MRQRARRIVAALMASGAAGVLVAGCAPGGTDDGATIVPGPSVSASVNNSIDPVNIDQIAATIRSRGLPLDGQRDATTELCGSVECTKAYAFDQFSIRKFPNTRGATLYNGSIEGGFQVLDLVVTFPPGSSSETTERYAAAVRQAVQ